MKTYGRLAGLVALFALATIPLAQAAWLNVNGMEHDYLTLNYYIDEDAGTSETILLDFWPPEGVNVERAQIWSNLGRRDYATLADQDADSMPGPQPGSEDYFVGFEMSHQGGNHWQLTLPVDKTGAYRLTARYQEAGSSEWTWVGKRDTAIMVSPKKARDVILYELMVNVINADGNDFASRSTFEDLMNPAMPANLDYFESLGVNTLWIQPIHPIGEHRCVDTAEGPGSPYSIQNMWEVAPHMSWGNTRPDAMAAFTNFAAQAGARGIDFFFDIIFNHTSWDAEIARDPYDPTQPAADPYARIRDVKYAWYSRFTGGDYETVPCDASPSAWNQADFDFENPAGHVDEVGPAPAERIDFGKWWDVIALYWGKYPALFNPHTDTDEYWDASDEVKRMTEYFAEFGRFWIEQSGGTLGGFRCDYAQGIPPQAWEYIVNRMRQLKWDFIFMAESLDGGNVSKRAGRHMDIINQNWIWQVLGGGHNTSGLRGAIDENKSDYGYAGIMRGIINHDQNAPDDIWWSFSRYAVGAVVDGAPQMYQGQELGYRNGWGFSRFRVEHDRAIPDIFKWHHMRTLWDNADEPLQDAYRRVNRARSRNIATRLHDQWYLDQTGGNGVHEQIFSVLKYDRFGWDPAHQNVVLNFVNLQPWTAHSATFDLASVGAIYINPERNYNVRNLMADDDSVYLWPGDGRTGQDIIDNGIGVIFPEDGMENPDTAFVQMLVFEEHGGHHEYEPYVHFSPEVPVGCGPITITYRKSESPLGGSPVYIHIGRNGWQDVILPNPVMQSSGDFWSYTYTPPPNTYEINVVFNDGADDWDNNNGADWHLTVTDCGDDPLPGDFAITNPPSNIAVGNEVSTYTLQGLAEDVIGHITWSNAANGATGSIPVASPWTIGDLPLAVGPNVITVRGTNTGSSGVITHSADASGNYLAHGWLDGANQGTGWDGGWALNADDDAGHFIATAANNENMRIGSSAFGLWSQSNNLSEAMRRFEEPMEVGQTLQTTFQNNWVMEDPMQGVGVALRNTAGDSLIQFYFNGGDDYYQVEDSAAARDTGIGWTDQPLSVAIELTSTDNYKMTVDGTEITGNYDGDVAEVRFWNWSGGVGQNYDVFFGDISLTSEGSAQGVSTSATVTITRAPADETDSDGDGIPDWWELQYFGNITGAVWNARNPSGMTNWESYVAGLNPNQPSARFVLVPVDAAGESVTFTWPHAEGRRYSVYRSTDITDPESFILLQGNISGNEYVDTDPPEDGRAFYRIQVELE